MNIPTHKAQYNHNILQTFSALRAQHGPEAHHLIVCMQDSVASYPDTATIDRGTTWMSSLPQQSCQAQLC